MLNMGFVEDIETILNAAKDNDDLQTLLFSATLPKWVADIARRFLTAGHTTVDLVGDEKRKGSGSVQHMLMPCQWSERTELVCDLIRAKVPGDGRVIVFCDTKRDCGELSRRRCRKELKKGAKALHGDVNQSQREVVLAGFRANKFQTLVATDVAARGLDISGVELVVQCDPQRGGDVHPPLGAHRPRRRHRRCVTLCTPRNEWAIPNIERKGGFKFQKIAPPQPAEMVAAAAKVVISQVRGVHKGAAKLFMDAAAELLAAGAGEHDEGADPTQGARRRAREARRAR